MRRSLASALLFLVVGASLARAQAALAPSSNSSADDSVPCCGVLGIEGSFLPGRAGHSAGYGGGLDFGLIASRLSSQSSFVVWEKLGFSNIAGHPGGDFEWTPALTFGPMSQTKPPFALLYVDTALGLRAGAPYHFYAAPGVGVNWVASNRAAPFFEIRWRQPVGSPWPGGPEIILGIRLPVHD